MIAWLRRLAESSSADAQFQAGGRGDIAGYGSPPPGQYP